MNHNEMKTGQHIAKVELDINASPEDVWQGLTSPEAVKQYMMGAKLETDWKEGSPMAWKGEFKGRAFEDKGTVLRAVKPEHLAYSHLSTGEKDSAENYHKVDIRLAAGENGTHLTLTQDNNATEAARAGSEKNWKLMMEGLKKVVEG